MKYKNLIKQMSLEDKVAFCSGFDFWKTKEFKKYNIPSIMLSDGPHGLRKQIQEMDHLGINKSKPATCFPPACTTACSWDRDLIGKIGEAIAKEALNEGVSVVLGPGVNIKRNPLCGRNFEYFSEDPYLAGELAACFIQGVQKYGIGTSLKHFAANNQENKRFYSDSILDERTFREIYLTGFEIAVKKGKPSTVMCAYNKINGIYCSDNKYLIREILRNEWGYKGVVVTDWGAMNNRISAFEAGTDLEMPGGADYFDKETIEAVKNGKLSEERIDESVDRLLELVFKCSDLQKKEYTFNPLEHHLLARKAAANSAVLLKNDDNILPLNKSKKIAVIGSFAKKIRYQGNGSSHVNPTKLTNILTAFDEEKIQYGFYEGCREDGSTDDTLIKEAVDGAKTCDVAVIFAGLPENYESEGFDRETLSMPDGHIRMIQEVARANPNTVVVLMCGSVITMPWLDNVKAVLHMYLPGQAGGEACTDLLFGAVNPSGKLAETYPISYEDVPSAVFYENGGKQAQYREGIYVGYRYYDKAGKKVCFPFGFGLSYTTFEYSNMKIHNCNGENYKVTLLVKNTGKMAGAEIVQLYVSDMQQGIHRPEKELKGFEKVFLEPGEEKEVTFYLDKRSFAYYDVNTKDWEIQRGKYHIQIGASSRDIRLSQTVSLEGTVVPVPQTGLSGTWYEHLKGKPQKADFEKLLGREIPEPKPVKKKNYTMENSIMDMSDSFVIRTVFKAIEKNIGKAYGGVDYNNPAFKVSVLSSTDVPMKNLCIISGGKMPRNVAEGLVHMANGRFIKGLTKIIKK
ncbi:MAG: Thermostable beta-glucosidase B [Lachnoclostridium sp.]|jgi:beta-glucosidase